MAGNKYLKIGTANTPFAEQEATQVSAGAGNAGEIVALDSSGKLDPSLLPSGLGVNVDLFAASENLSAGDFVNKWDDAGTTKVRKADATNGRRAHGFVKAAVTSGNTATVYGPGELNDAVTPSAGGQHLYLSASAAGGFQTTIPTTPGHIMQPLGESNSTTAMRFLPEPPTLRA